MVLDQEQSLKWSRYGMVPYNWILDGRLMASVYPPGLEYLKHLRIEEGITSSINLSESPWPMDWIERSGIHHHHFPVVDMSTPTEDDVRRIFRIIEGTNGATMIHCAAGIGRTGTVMALYLVEHGFDPEDAIRSVRKKRQGSIQTFAQEMMVRKWQPKRK